MKLIYTSILFALLLNGCVTLSKKAEGIQIHHQTSNLLDGCKRLGAVTGNGQSMLSPEQATEIAKIRIRENTADLGGDSVVLLNTDALTNVTTWEARTQGIAFRCY